MKGFQVAVLGAAGGIGQPLSLLLKLNARVSKLHLYDVAPITPGVGVDLSHCDPSSTCVGFAGQDALIPCLTGCDLVIIPAGVPRKPGMTRDDLFNINAGIVKTLVEGIAKACPNAFVAIISNPVNSTVPIAAEILKANGVYDKRRLFGVTTLDVVRARRFVAEKANGVVRPEDVDIPVVGGHAGKTILPLLSQVAPAGCLSQLSQADVQALTARIQDAGTEVVEAKAGGGSATLSMAYAAAQFAESCLRALSGESVVECAYVDSTVVEGLNFFASKVKLGPTGAEEVFGLGPLSPFEQEGLTQLKAELKGSIDKGVAFASAAAGAHASA